MYLVNKSILYEAKCQFPNYNLPPIHELFLKTVKFISVMLHFCCLITLENSWPPLLIVCMKPVLCIKTLGVPGADSSFFQNLPRWAIYALHAKALSVKSVRPKNFQDFVPKEGFSLPSEIKNGYTVTSRRTTCISKIYLLTSQNYYYPNN